MFKRNKYPKYYLFDSSKPTILLPVKTQLTFDGQEVTYECTLSKGSPSSFNRFCIYYTVEYFVIIDLNRYRSLDASDILRIKIISTSIDFLHIIKTIFEQPLLRVQDYIFYFGMLHKIIT